MDIALHTGETATTVADILRLWMRLFCQTTAPWQILVSWTPVLRMEFLTSESWRIGYCVWSWMRAARYERLCCHVHVVAKVRYHGLKRVEQID